MKKPDVLTAMGQYFGGLSKSWIELGIALTLYHPEWARAAYGAEHDRPNGADCIKLDQELVDVLVAQFPVEVIDGN